ncbi:MAG: MFS transporter [Ilumatobacteraceae bacterium]
MSDHDADLAVDVEHDLDRFPGWRVVTGAFIVLMTASGLAFYGLAVYLNAFSRERDWEVASVSFATTVFFFVSGAFGLVVARLIARYDLRYVVVGGGIAGGASLAVLGQVQHQWQLYIVYSVFAIGFAAAGLVPMTTVVTRWFHRRRGVALSVASTGLSAGGVFVTPLAKWLIDEQGLEAGTPILGLAFVLGTVPFALWLVRPDPAAVGWMPDGERSVAGVLADAPTGVPYASAVRSRFYVGVTIGYVLALGSQVGGIQQLVRLAEERTDRTTATLATLFLAATSIVARLVGGRIVAYVPMMGFTAALAAVQALALVALAVSGSTLALLASIILFGATVGNILMLQPLLIAERFGVADYPRIYSRSQFYSTLGVAGGPLLLGWLHDNAGGYRTSYLVAGGCALAGAGVLALGGPATVDES